MFTITSKLVVGLAVSSSLIAATPSPTQGSNASGTPARDHSFVLAIVDSVPRVGAIAATVRYADPAQTDVVLLSKSAATPETLAGVLANLEASRTLDPPITGTQYTFITEAKPVAGLPESRRAILESALAQVRAQPVTRIGNVGEGRWKQFPDTWVRADHRG